MTTLALLAGYAGGLLTGITLTALFVSQPARRAKKKRLAEPKTSLLEALRRDHVIDPTETSWASLRETDPRTARFVAELRAVNQATYAKERRAATTDTATRDRRHVR